MALLNSVAGASGLESEPVPRQDPRSDSASGSGSGPGLASLLIRNALQNAWQALADGLVDEGVAQFTRASLLAHGNRDAMSGMIFEAERLTRHLRDLAVQREQHRVAYATTDTAVNNVRAQLDQLLDSADATTALSANGTSRSSAWLNRLLSVTGIRVRVADPVVEIMPLPKPEVASPAIHAALLLSTSTSVAPFVPVVSSSISISQLQEVSSGTAVCAQTLAIHLFGQLRVAFGDRPIERPTSGRARAVLAYLALHRHQPIDRDTLMDAIWPDASASSARNSLNVAVHALRQSVKAAGLPDLVRYHTGQYSLSIESTEGMAGDIWVDADEFLQRVELGRAHESREAIGDAIAEYEAAVTLYQGDLLGDSPYEDWTTLPREKMRLTYMDALDRLGRIYLETGQHVACIAQCQRILAQDACREDAHCMLMRCFMRQNQPHLALRQFRACADALQNELGVPPSAATLALHERIRAGECV